MIHITIEELTDGLCARAALCGDITGRGYILGDNDIPALERLLRVTVPRAFHSLGLTWNAAADGWDVDIDEHCAAALEAYILDHITRRDPTSSAAIFGEIPRLVGEP